MIISNHSLDNVKCTSEVIEATSFPYASSNIIMIFLSPLYRKWCSRFLSLFPQRRRQFPPYRGLQWHQCVGRVPGQAWRVLIPDAWHQTHSIRHPETKLMGSLRTFWLRKELFWEYKNEWIICFSLGKILGMIL